MTQDITQLLCDYQNGDEAAMESLFPFIYKELHQIAHRQLKNVWSVETICTTALVNEAYLKLASGSEHNAKNRNHFFAIAAKAMRQILINYSKQKQAKKRGGEWQRTDSVDALEDSEKNIDNILAIDRALTELEMLDPPLCRLVELRFFAGMTEQEVASVLGVTERTVRRNWQKAKLLLAKAI